MGCPPDVLARIAVNITQHPRSADYWLDRWLDLTTRATDWDAQAWGFDPVRWMCAERARMDIRAQSSCQRPAWWRTP